MVSAVQQTNYFDLAALNKIKLQSKTDSKEALKAVASEFEAIFLKMMLKSMREANLGNPLFDSDSAKFYQEMYDDQLALDLSKKGGIGLADTLVKQLSRYLPQENKQDIKTEKSIAPKTETILNNQDIIKTPKEFVKKLMPYAETAAFEIGVKPKVLLAQAALETGWGKYIIQKEDGKSSFNLFNIKADNRWEGKNTSISTVEYFGNKPTTRQANFRVYDSYQESFEDYVNFLKQSPRYTSALQNTHSAEAFTNSLQKAGYATDPQYARKIQRILSDKPLNDALQKLNFEKQNNMTVQQLF